MAILNRLVLKDFRNYETLDLEFADGINVFLGANGQGKSNLLEAIYFLSILRSFRCSRQKNLYRWRKPSFMISGRINDAGHTVKVGIEYAEKRRLRINGETIRKASDFIGRLYTVAFVPEDIELIKGSASDRRRFMDITLSQLVPGYLQKLQSYEKALKSRNTLLRVPNCNSAALSAYDDVVIRYGCELIFERQKFFVKINPFLTQSATDLLPDTMVFSLKYQSLTGVTAESTLDAIGIQMKQALVNNYERDRHYGKTHSGPHRDDIMMFINKRSLNDFGSEGQCRLAAMILKLAKASLLYEEKGEDSITLLVDDVIGELDERGCKAFMKCISRADQVFIACTEEEKLHGIESARSFSVENGVVTLIEI